MVSYVLIDNNCVNVTCHMCVYSFLAPWFDLFALFSAWFDFTSECDLKCY